ALAGLGASVAAACGVAPAGSTTLAVVGGGTFAVVFPLLLARRAVEPSRAARLRVTHRWCAAVFGAAFFIAWRSGPPSRPTRAGTDARATRARASSTLTLSLGGWYASAMPEAALPQPPGPERAPDRRRAAVRYAVPVLKLGVRRLLHRKSPFQMTLSLTNRCNFRCTYCEIPLQHRDEMSTAEWFGAIDELHAGGLGRASIIGGEPLLRKDAGQIVDHLKRRGIHASMNTNGWLVAERIDELRNLDLVCVTLDGPEAIHDRQRHP